MVKPRLNHREGRNVLAKPANKIGLQAFKVMLAASEG